SAGSLPLSFAYRLDPLEPTFSPFAAAATKSYSNLLNGTYTFYVIAKDAAGNTETPGAAPGASNRRTFTISAPDLPPSVSFQVTPASPSASGSVSFTWTGSDDLTPATSLVYDRWLAPLQSDPATFTSSTTASFSGLVDGSYTFHVVAKDGAGNLGADATSTFVVARPPLVTITQKPGSPNSTGNVDFAWTATDDSTPTPAITYDAWLSPGQSDPGTFSAATSASYASLVDGTYTFHVKAMDAAGNVSGEATATFTVARPPDTQLLSAPTGTINVADAAFTWTGSDDAPGTLTYASQLVGFDAAYSSFSANTSRAYANLPNGTYTFQVKARDAAGNVDPTPASQSFTVAVVSNSTPPAVPSPASAALVPGKRQFQVTWTDVATETSYTVQRCQRVSAVCNYATVASNVAANTTSLLNTVRTDGVYSFRVQACNAFGCSGFAVTNDITMN
ncbi:MAG TPA: triple tyrosine motif-containing protein, partial [Casimicrobiaceae bacterium]|nr:triple tyrosine motif-containing protein [Casimicrobiaceae bacterium]